MTINTKSRQRVKLLTTKHSKETRVKLTMSDEKNRRRNIKSPKCISSHYRLTRTSMLKQINLIIINKRENMFNYFVGGMMNVSSLYVLIAAWWVAVVGSRRVVNLRKISRTFSSTSLLQSNKRREDEARRYFADNKEIIFHEEINFLQVHSSGVLLLLPRYFQLQTL